MKYWLAVMMAFVSLQGFAEETPRTSIALESQGSQTFYINSMIHGAGEARLLVDTGSGYSVINEDTLTALQEKGHARYIKTLRGILANGTSQVVPLYEISAITLGEKCVVRNVRAAVFPNANRQILGISTLLKTAPFEISVSPPMLRLTGCEASSVTTALKKYAE